MLTFLQNLLAEQLHEKEQQLAEKEQDLVAREQEVVNNTQRRNPEIIDLSSDPVTPAAAMPAITKGRDWRAATASQSVKSINDIVVMLTILDPITNTTIPASEAGITFPETAFTAFRDDKGFATFQQGVLRPSCLTRKARKSQPQEVKAGITEACAHCLYYGEVCVYIQKVNREITRVILPVPEEYRSGVNNAGDVRMYIAPGQHRN